MKPCVRIAAVTWQGRRQFSNEKAPNTSNADLQLLMHEARDSGKERCNFPLELIAAAHASSFSAALAEELRRTGHRPHQIHTLATVTMEKLASRWTLSQIHLDATADVAGVAQCDFVDAALRARENCPLCRALTVTISMCARLKSRETSGEPAPLAKQRVNPKKATSMRRPKGVKTKKSVVKRFKITAKGKVLFHAPGRRHLLQTKSAKRRRSMRKVSVLGATDLYRVKQNLPFSR
jgi:ribosomal protein L35